MNIVCVICSDLLLPSDDVFYTPCGHTFHFACLTQWLDRSKTCPQCREKTTQQKIHRLYFNFSNNDTIVEDTCSLQDKVDKLNFQLALKEKDIKHYAEKTETLGNQNKQLKKEVHKVESQLNEKTSTIYALKEQMKYFKQQHAETESKSKEIEQLQKKLETCRNVQTLLEASTEEVEEMIARTSDPNTLITYISVMKREMTISLSKRRELRTKVKSLQQELTKVSMERNFLLDEREKGRKLEECLVVCEGEKMSLQNRIKELKRHVSLMRKPMNYDGKVAEPTNSNSNCSPKRTDIKKLLNNAKIEEQDIDQEDGGLDAASNEQSDSPYLPVKSGGVFVLKSQSCQKRSTMIISGSILTKRPRIEQASPRNEQAGTNAIVYNGFGGHSKFDQFPSTSVMRIKRTKDDMSKQKKSKLDVDGNQKLINFVTNLT